jgi:hypothetical protein
MPKKVTHAVFSHYQCDMPSTVLVHWLLFAKIVFLWISQRGKTERDLWKYFTQPRRAAIAENADSTKLQSSCLWGVIPQTPMGRKERVSPKA